MLFAPYSSTILTRLPRKPVNIAATMMTVITPMMMPSTVSVLRNLCARIDSNAMPMMSLVMKPGSRINVLSLISGQRDNRIKARCFEGRIDAGDDTDAARHADGEQDVENGDRHRDRRQHSHEPRETGRQQ